MDGRLKVNANYKAFEFDWTR